MRVLVLIGLLVIMPTLPAETATASASLWSPQGRQQLEQYRLTAQRLVEAIRGGAGQDEVKTAGDALIDLAGALIPEFAARHPDCREYLAIAKAGAERWQELDYETIERDYHDDGALPKVGNAQRCYHMKDLVVHPATALVLMSQAEPDRRKAAHEIDEVIAHLSVVRAQ